MPNSFLHSGQREAQKKGKTNPKLGGRVGWGEDEKVETPKTVVFVHCQDFLSAALRLGRHFRSFEGINYRASSNSEGAPRTPLVPWPLGRLLFVSGKAGNVSKGAVNSGKTDFSTISPIPTQICQSTNGRSNAPETVLNITFRRHKLLSNYPSDYNSSFADSRILFRHSYVIIFFKLVYLASGIARW